MFLERGKQYCFTFRPKHLPTGNPLVDHLLYFTQDPMGGKVNDPLAVPGTPPPFGTNMTVCFTITDTFPTVFYYQCQNHKCEGGTIIVNGAPSGGGGGGDGNIT